MHNTQQDIWQNQWLERRCPEDARKNDVRSPWARDYARIIHSAAFRRLQSKTQVLVPGDSDFYRTRLTHSMEVAQVGSGIRTYLERIYENSPIVHALPDERLLAAICLAHDIGHPPFGHGGEIALNVCMREYGGFEGNGQSLRILSRLEQYTPQDGLNATRRLLLGVLKYPVSYNELVRSEIYDAPHKDQMPHWLVTAKKHYPPKCYHNTECAVVDWILAPLGEDRAAFCRIDATDPQKHKKTQYASLDTSIMNLADDIAYAVHDLEDSVAMGMLTRAMWREFMQAKADIFQECGFIPQEVEEDIFSSKEYERKGRVGGLIHYLITHTEIVESGLGGCPLIAYTARLMPAAKALQKALGQLVAKYVIFSPNVQLLEFRGQKIVIELFDVFASDPLRLLPLNVRSQFMQAEAEGHMASMRIVCDYIASMTDAGAARLHEKIFRIGKGSIFDKF